MLKGEAALISPRSFPERLQVEANETFTICGQGNWPDGFP